MTALHVHDLGDPAGEPLLAIHGITGHGLRFRRSAAEGWPHRRTLAVDLRGHGRSTWDGPWSVPQHVADLLDTLDAAGLAKVDVVGHSYGGTIALALLAAAPERVRRLVLLDPALLRPGAWTAQTAEEAMAFEGWGSVQEATAWRNAGLGDEIHPDVRDDVAEHLVQGPDGRYRFRFSRPAVVTGWGELSLPLPAVEVRRPTLLVVAERAGIVTADVVAGLTALLGADLQVVRLDCGHMVYWEDFEATVVAVDTFLTP